MKVVITHAFGPMNRGDHELLEKLINILVYKFGNNVSISVFTRFPKQSTKFFPRVHFFKTPVNTNGLVNNKLLNYIFNFFLWVMSGPFPVLRKCLPLNLKECVNELETADLIIMCPGGYLYSNGKSLITNLAVAFFFRFVNAPYVLSPMSIGPFKNKIEEWFVKILLKNADKVFTRESYSHNLVKGLKNQSTLSTDLALWRDDIEIEPSNSWNGYYVGTVLSWDFPFAKDKLKARARYKCEFINACKQIKNMTGRPVILYRQVGEVFGTGADDTFLSSIIQDGEDSVILFDKEMTPIELRSYIAGSLGIIASRFHSAIFALQAKVPFIALAYQPKSEYILKDNNLSDYYRDIATFDGKEVADFLCETNREVFKLLLNKTEQNSSDLINNTFISYLDNYLI